MAYANCEMLALARKARGLTQPQLANRLKVTQGHVSKWERGQMEIPEDRLPDIAKELDFPVEFFERPERVHDYGPPCLYHRKRQTMPAILLHQIEAQVNIARLAVEELLADIEVETEQGFPRFDIDEYDSPEQIAQELRHHWRLPHGPITNLVRTIESAGGVVIRRFFGTRKIDAISQWPPDGHPIFVVNADIPTDRVRFTLAHEIGHLVMHTIPSDDPEREADRFASEFLMPAIDILPDLEDLTLQRAASLKLYWRVSMAALVRRAHDLGQITQRQYQRFVIRLRDQYKYVEPNPLTPEEPTVISDAINVHRNVHGYSLSEVWRLAKLHERDFRESFMPKTSLRLITT